MNTALLAAMQEQADILKKPQFEGPIAYTYRPLKYAWDIHQKYVCYYGNAPKKVVFLGMNPGPFGMAQTGIPFGEVNVVRDWLGITGAVIPPADQHPRRPILGMDCTRSEVSGTRLWGLFKQRYLKAESFFKDHYVLNYCSLVFMEASGKNITPEQFPLTDRKKLCGICDPLLLKALKTLKPTWVVAVGRFAYSRLQALNINTIYKLAVITHPSPANPRAAHDWGALATQQLKDQGVW